jgi:hypothetical protein
VIPIIATWRDFREFLAAKKRKREPIRFHAKGVGESEFRPRDARAFERWRATCRGVGDWGRASERIDALEHALQSRHACGLPLPRKVIQNDDCSITLFWEGLLVRCFVDGVFTSIGGARGIKAKAVTREVLDLLAFQKRIQGQ